MLLSLIIVAIIGVVAYFHYLQGFFSSALSAVISIIAALVAVGYHETMAGMVNGGKFSDYVVAVCLVSIYAVVYILLRTLFDSAVPGNVRFPLLVDRVGGGVMGVIAGLFAAGILAIAVQSLGFGPSLAMYERYPIKWGKTIAVQGPDMRRPDDAMFDELESDKFVRNESGDAQGLWVPADDLVLKLVNLASSEGASLDCGKPFQAVHPDYLQELFGSRVGLQSGSKHTAMANTANVIGIYTAAKLAQDDTERWQKDGQNIGIRGPKGNPGIQALPADFMPGPGKMILVLRTRVDRKNTDDKSNMLAFAPGGIRLVAGRKNYFPIGTLEAGRVLFRSMIDDPLFSPGDKAIDLVFEVPEGELLASVAEKATSPKLAAGTFLEVKRFARVQLEDKEINKTIEAPGDAVAMVVKQGSRTGSGDAQQAAGPLSIEGNPVTSNELFSAINIPNIAEANAKGETEWGKYVMKDQHFVMLEINPVRTIQFLSQGKDVCSMVNEPDGQKIVQISARPSAKSQDKWAWGDVVSQYQLGDAAGKRYPPVGALAKVKRNDGQDMMAGVLDLTKSVRSVASDRNSRPTDVYLLYLVPVETELRSLEFKGDIIRSMSLKVQ